MQYEESFFFLFVEEEIDYYTPDFSFGRVGKLTDQQRKISKDYGIYLGEIPLRTLSIGMYNVKDCGAICCALF